MGKESREKITKNTITQKCFEISQPNFYQLKISSEVNFSQSLMGIAWKMVLPCPWPFQTSQGRGRLIFWATPSKFGEKIHLLIIFKWCEIMFLIPPLVSDLRKSGWAAPYIYTACTWVKSTFQCQTHRGIFWNPPEFSETNNMRLLLGLILVFWDFWWI